jgi:hypothetical protein
VEKRDIRDVFFFVRWWCPSRSDALVGLVHAIADVI